MTNTFVTSSFLGAALLIAACAGSTRSDRPTLTPVPPLPPSSAPGAEDRPPAPKIPAAEGIDVLLCDGKTQVNVPQGTPGTSIAGALMTEWLRKNPNSTWEAEERERHTLQTSADNSTLVGQVSGHTYGKITQQDVALWKSETERVATAGSRVFHNGDELGSTIGVSCDMCHPHAANTHPETYPKFQAQLGRVALLRDMINWCIEKPNEGIKLAEDSDAMKALEAYIYWSNRGSKLDAGRH